VIFAQAFIFQNFEIPSGSMEKTLLIGDHVLVDRSTFAPPSRWAPFIHHRDIRRGDIIVFLKPTPEDLILVKRAIGLPGDRIHLRNGIVYLNGVAQNDPRPLSPTTTTATPMTPMSTLATTSLLISPALRRRRMRPMPPAGRSIFPITSRATISLFPQA
jgi:signal peptidase I